MRIDSSYGPQASAASDQTAGKSPGSATRPETSDEPAAISSGEDTAQLSGTHLQVQALAAQASQAPEVRQDRVEALRQAIQSGRYQANPQQTAGALFTHMAASAMA